jgi:hypothetical protein
MKWKIWSLLAGGLLGLAACGPMDDGGGGVVGDVCTPNSTTECVPNGCCGRGTAVVNVSRAPNCSMVTCSPNDPDPTNQTVNNGCGLPFCDGSGHCAVATRC